jgi:hypothetical protein
MKANVKSLIAILLTTVIGIGCSKDEKPVNPDEQATVELSAANVTAEGLYDDVFSEVLTVNTENGLTRPSGQAQTTACATITVDPIDPDVYPKTITIDYGSGCTNLGVTRKGKIVYTLTDKFRNPGAIISVSFQNYNVNGYKLEGVFSITNNTSGLTISLATQTTAGKLTYPDGKFYTYSGQRTWVMTAGMLTAALSDDEYTVTGNGLLESSTGNSLAGTIKTGLLRKLSCMNIVSGTIDLVYNNIQGLFDYGTGNCDKQATVKVGDKVYDVTLP